MNNRLKEEIECVQATYPETTVKIFQEKVVLSLPLNILAASYEKVNVMGDVIFTILPAYPEVEGLSIDFEGATEEFVGVFTADELEYSGEEQILSECFRIQTALQDFFSETLSLPKNSVKECSLFENEHFCNGLRDCGFVKCGPDIWVESTGGRGVTLERDGVQALGVWVSCDGLHNEDVIDFLRLLSEKSKPNAADYSTWPKQILQWTRANTTGDGFEEEEDGTGEDHNEIDCSIETLFLNPELKRIANPERELRVSTWGRALMKGPPIGAVNFNASVLSGRGHGVNTRKMNGLWIEIQSQVSKCSMFPMWIELVIRKIEKEDIHHISINCTKGRHRSVAAAELLKKLYYKRADIHHLTIV